MKYLDSLPVAIEPRLSIVDCSLFELQGYIIMIRRRQQYQPVIGLDVFACDSERKAESCYSLELRTTSSRRLLVLPETDQQLTHLRLLGSVGTATGTLAAEVDKLAETKGEDWFDREKAKRDAEHHAERMYDEHYIDNHGADQYDPQQYGRPEKFARRGW